MNRHSRSQSQLTPQLNPQETLAALLEQLVYIDTFMNGGQTTPNLDADGQLSMELAAFADDLFVFPDETKSEADHRWNDFDEPQSLSSAQAANQNHSSNQSHGHNGPLGALPKFPVPPGAKLLLELAGLSLNQIDLLSALVAQHQQLLGKQIPSTSVDASVTPSTTSTLSLLLLYPMAPLPIFDLASGFGSSHATPPSHPTPHQNHMLVYLLLLHPLPSLLEDNASQALPLLTELDKRRRNTAASARFRIKKKMKEKQMELRIVELNSTVKDFELKISRLEMENKLLRNLIIEKGSQKSDDELKQLKEKVMRRND